MELWQIQTITQALQRCYGLQDCLNTKEGIEALARQTGFRVSFLTVNITFIKTLNT